MSNGITYEGEIDGGEGDVIIINDGPNTINIVGDVKASKGVVLVNGKNYGPPSKTILHDVDTKGTLSVTTNAGGNKTVFKKGIKARNVVIVTGDDK
jgi:hypothetical protein